MGVCLETRVNTFSNDNRTSFAPTTAPTLRGEHPLAGPPSAEQVLSGEGRGARPACHDFGAESPTLDHFGGGNLSILTDYWRKLAKSCN
jgi:hypothetical protein